MQSTIEKNTTDKLRAEHRRCVKDISGALAQLEDALVCEKDFRAKLHADNPKFAATIGPLKLADHIKLCPTGSRESYAYIHEWRANVRSRGLLEEEA